MQNKKNPTALMKAADLLARQEQSSQKLKQKLLTKKYSAAEVDDAIKTLTERNYLNDEETCRRQFENLYAEEKLSVRQICAKLFQRGFDKDFVKNLIPDNFEQREIKIADKIFEKKFAEINFDNLDAKEKFKLKNKIYQHLSGKGFSSEIISELFETKF